MTTDHAKLIKDMDQKLKTIQRVARHYRPDSIKGTRALINYDDAKEKMVEAGLWSAWCKEKNFVSAHDASDLFA